MTTPMPIAEGFSVSHAQICDGITSFEDYLATIALQGRLEEDIYGVNEASLEPDTDDYENEGDDRVQSTWTWFNYAEVSVQNGYVSFPMIANLTGRNYSSSGSGAAIAYTMDLWHEDSLNVPPRPMIIKMPSKDSRGAPRVLTVGLFRVQFAPISFEGPEYKEGLKLNYNGRAVLSRFDEEGTAFTDGKARGGRLLSTAVL